MAVPSGGANYSASSPRGLQWPEDTAVLPSVVTGKEETLVTGISTRFTLLCGSHKLTETGHHEQVAGELLSATMAVKIFSKYWDQEKSQNPCKALGADSVKNLKTLRRPWGPIH